MTQQTSLIPRARRPRLVELRATNFLRLEAVSIRPRGNLTKIEGRNAQGKTSVLEALAALFTTRRQHPEEVIRRGTAAAEVIGEFHFDDGTGFCVERHWKIKKDGDEVCELRIRGLGGEKYPSTQKWLDEMSGGSTPLAYNPVGFLRQPPIEKRATLMKLQGYDTTRVDAQRAQALEAKGQAEREVTMRATRLLGIQADPDAPSSFVLIEDLLAEQERLIAEDRRIDGLDEAVRLAVAEETRAKAEVESIEGQIAAMQARLEAARETLEKASQRADETSNAAGVADRPDLETIRQQLAEAEGMNARVREARERADIVAEMTTWQTQVEEKTAAIVALDDERKAILSAKPMPVDGLGFSDGGVTFRGIPLEQASGAEQLRVSVGIAISMMPETGPRILLVRDGSLLDDDSLALLEEMAEERDVDVILERVGVDGDGIVIEDGRVLSPDGWAADKPKEVH